MEEYKYKEHLKKQIMGEDRHHMIYGYNNAKRRDLIDTIVEENPITFDTNKPAAILVKPYGIPVQDAKPNKEDIGQLKISSSEYFQLSVADSIVKRLMEARTYEPVDVRMDPLTRYLTKATGEKVQVKSLEDAQSLIEESQDYYLQNYIELLKDGVQYRPITSIALQFINLESFIYYARKATNNNAHFALIIDKDMPIEAMSTRTINFYTGARINDMISMKIFTAPNDWETYTDCNGQLVQEPHDYGDIELDKSMKDHIAKEKRMRNGNRV